MTMNRQTPERRARRYYKVKAALTEMGYQLLTPVEDYKGNITPLHTICPNGHENTVKYWASYQRGRQCRQCFIDMTTSKGEKEVTEFVKECIPFEVIENDRSVILNPLTGHNLEIDIWIPELNKAIEYNGEYWHGRFTDNDAIKIRYCEENDISLMVIWDTQWRDNTDKIKHEIIEFIHKEDHCIQINDNKWVDYYKNWTPTEPTEYYRITEPNGSVVELFKGTLQQYCDEHDLSYSSMVQVVNGYNRVHKGYHIEYTSEEDKQRALDTRLSMSRPTGISLRKKTVLLTDSEGKTHTVSNINRFCKENDLSNVAISLVVKGQRKSHKGWTGEIL